MFGLGSIMRMILLLLRSGMRSAVGRSYLIAYSWSQRGRTVVRTAQKSWQPAELAKVTRLSLEARSARQRRHSDFSDFLGNTGGHAAQLVPVARSCVELLLTYLMYSRTSTIADIYTHALVYQHYDCSSSSSRRPRLLPVKA